MMYATETLYIYTVNPQNQVTMLISAITADPSIQPRAGLNPSKLKQFIQILEHGGELAPIILFFDGQTYWLADGFHRHQAYLRTERTEIPVKVHEGSFRDAILCGIRSNAHHGIGLKLNERRNAAWRLLLDSEWCMWNDKYIGRICGLDHDTVKKIRLKIASETIDCQNLKLLQSVSVRNRIDSCEPDSLKPFPCGNFNQSTSIENPELLQSVSVRNRIDNFDQSNSPIKRRVTRNGKSYDMDVSKIGRKINSKTIDCEPHSNVIELPLLTQTFLEVLPPSLSNASETLHIHSVQFDEPLISDNQYEFKFTLLTSGSAHALPCIINMMCDFPSFAQYVYRQARILATQSSSAL